MDLTLWTTASVFDSVTGKQKYIITAARAYTKRRRMLKTIQTEITSLCSTHLPNSTHPIYISICIFFADVLWSPAITDTANGRRGT